jgi:hypothetical protein
MALTILSFGILTPLALEMASLSRGLESGSGPPSFTATVISLLILEKIFDLLASIAPFLRLMVDHLLCPDIGFCFSDYELKNVFSILVLVAKLML